MNARTQPFAAALLATGVLLASCSNEAGAPAPSRDMLAVFAAEFRESRPAAAPELIALGRDLYHEQRLSTGNNISCASCHDLARFGQDGQATSPGSGGERGDRNSPSSVNAFRQIARFWDGRAKDVEEQAQGPVLNPIEHGFSAADGLLAAPKGIDGMTARFAAAFPGEDDPVTLANFGTAVGAFERTLVTTGRWEGYLDGDDAALTAAEKSGLGEFIAAGCTTCHIGRTVGGGMFQKLGLVVPYPTKDPGRARVTNNEAERFFLKVPVLLNVADTAPYFHDGSVATLGEAIRLMAEHQLGKDLTASQVTAIETFLQALTGEPQWTTD